MLSRAATSLIVGLSLAGIAPAAEPTDEQRVQEYFRTVGRLTPEYTANLACAQEQLGMGPFQELKENVTRWFGEDFAARVQADYDRTRDIIENTPPSERAEIAESMNCVAEAERLAGQISAAWKDGAWAMERAERAKGNHPVEPQAAQPQPSPTVRPDVPPR